MEQDSESSNFKVTSAEHDLKLLALLERHLGLPKSLLHRWVRTGQVRRNGKRCQPFERVAQGDLIRLPPFAFKLKGLDNKMPQLGPLPRLIGSHADLLCYCKPRGLPTHGGTGHLDSLAARLQQAFWAAPFIPVPVHRLDRDTSGLILVATTYRALRRTQEAWQNQLITKEYLCWVWGKWPYKEPRLLIDFVQKIGAEGHMKMQVIDSLTAKEARSFVTPMQICAKASLLLVQIGTGRTHQIRVQLAHAGYPIVGDHKYGAPTNLPLYLHATRLILNDGHEFCNFPEWDGDWRVPHLALPVPLYF
ncbi:MAG: RluA family pseudouridine synthase [Desulfovibrionaceae bacterium]|nr:RluA family pseudouridine synthase [Desulfovibrionaceae bacterium]